MYFFFLFFLIIFRTHPPKILKQTKVILWTKKMSFLPNSVCFGIGAGFFFLWNIIFFLWNIVSLQYFLTNIFFFSFFLCKKVFGWKHFFLGQKLLVKIFCLWKKKLYGEKTLWWNKKLQQKNFFWWKCFCKCIFHWKRILVKKDF